MPKMTQYAAYRGDEFLCVGSADEVAAYLGVEAETVRWMSTPSYRSRCGDSGRRTIVEKVDVNEEVCDQCGTSCAAR